jgi:stage II sporulation protein M
MYFPNRSRLNAPGKVVKFMSFKLRILTVIILFCLGLVLGLAMPDIRVFSLFSQASVLEELAEFIGSLPIWAVFIFILLKNISAVLFVFIASPLFLVVPVVSLVLNGWVIGAVSGTVVTEHSVSYLLTGLLPHGIIELPALFIGEAAALGFGLSVIQAVINRDRRDRIITDLRPDLKYLVISLILLVPAALIETFVTPVLLGK